MLVQVDDLIGMAGSRPQRSELDIALKRKIACVVDQREPCIDKASIVCRHRVGADDDRAVVCTHGFLFVVRREFRIDAKRTAAS